MTDPKNTNSQSKQEISISTERIYVLSMRFLVPVFILFFFPFAIFWGDDFMHKMKELFSAFHESGIRYALQFITSKIFVYLFVLIAGIILHELLHGLGWMILARKGFKAVSFGILWKYLTPYAHLKIPVTVMTYRTGILLPGVLLGIIPGLAGLVTGDVEWVFFGFLFTWSAAGDFIMLRMIRHLHSKQLVTDHPEKVGCYVLQQ